MHGALVGGLLAAFWLLPVAIQPADAAPGASPTANVPLVGLFIVGSPFSWFLLSWPGTQTQFAFAFACCSIPALAANILVNFLVKRRDSLSEP